MSSLEPLNNQMQKTGADSACQVHATLPTSDLERYVDMAKPPEKAQWFRLKKLLAD
jgi:hypothetical protein